MKHRLERVRELIKRELSEIITRDMVFENVLVTVQAVDITPDLRKSHIFIGAIGSAEAQRDAMHKLNENRVVLQHSLTKRVILKYTPKLHFHLNDSVERGAKVIGLMEQIDIPEDDEEPLPTDDE